MLVIGLKKCSTCLKVEKILQAKNLSYDYRDIVANPPTYAELTAWFAQTEQGIESFWNTSSAHYREGNYKELKKDLAAAEQLKLISHDPYLCKRPLLVTDDGKVFVGRKVQSYLENLN